jgi:NAD-dependent SIR2 family protein deacetylase
MEKVVQAHGANVGASCSKCKHAKDRKEWDKSIDQQVIMRCKEMVADPDDDQKKVLCNGPVKSNITFFGEKMPSRFHWGWDVINNTKWQSTDPIDESYGCDLMIVIGTGLAVWPF